MSAGRKPDVDPQTFFDLDLRVGRVVDVVALAGARKPAYRVAVDFGPDVGVLSTSAQITNYSPHELVGRLVVGALNLGTKRIAGFTSEFLVLGAMQPDGWVLLLSPDGEPQPGTPIG